MNKRPSITIKDLEDFAKELEKEINPAEQTSIIVKGKSGAMIEVRYKPMDFTYEKLKKVIDNN